MVISFPWLCQLPEGTDMPWDPWDVVDPSDLSDSPGLPAARTGDLEGQRQSDRPGAASAGPRAVHLRTAGTWKGGGRHSLGDGKCWES